GSDASVDSPRRPRAEPTPLASGAPRVETSSPWIAPIRQAILLLIQPGGPDRCEDVAGWSRSRARRDRAGVVVVFQPPAELVVDVFSEARREWLCYGELVGALALGLSLSSQEERGLCSLAMESVGEIEL